MLIGTMKLTTCQTAKSPSQFENLKAFLTSLYAGDFNCSLQIAEQTLRRVLARICKL